MQTATTHDPATLVTISQLCAAWGVSESSIRRLMAAGVIEAVRVGRLLRFNAALLERGPSAVAGGKTVQVR